MSVLSPKGVNAIPIFNRWNNITVYNHNSQVGHRIIHPLRCRYLSDDNFISIINVVNVFRVSRAAINEKLYENENKCLYSKWNQHWSLRTISKSSQKYYMFWKVIVDNVIKRIKWPYLHGDYSLWWPRYI